MRKLLFLFVLLLTGCGLMATPHTDSYSPTYGYADGGATVLPDRRTGPERPSAQATAKRFFPAPLLRLARR